MTCLPLETDPSEKSGSMHQSKSDTVRYVTGPGHKMMLVLLSQA